MSEKMIVACPKCETRFVAPLEKFLPRGRKVRCAKCGHAWFQNVDGSVNDLVMPTNAGVATSTETAAPTVTETVAPKVTETAAQPASRAVPPTESIMDRATRAADKPGFEQTAQSRAPIIEGADSTVREASSGIGAAAATTVAAGAATTAAAGAAIAGSGTTDAHDGPESGTGAERRKQKPRRRSWFPRLLFYCFAAAVIAGAVGYFFKDQIVEKVPSLDPPLTSWKQNVDAVVSKVIPQKSSTRIDNVKYDINETGDEPALLVTADVFNESNGLIEAPKLSVTLFDANDAVLEELSLAPEDIAGKIAAQESAPYFLRMPFPPEELDRVEVDFAK